MSTTTEDDSQRSPVPFSPFSDAVTVSEATTDEGPDLGQFNFVFRTLTHLQPHPWIPAFNGVYLPPNFTSLTSLTERGGHDRIDGELVRGEENVTGERTESGETMTMMMVMVPTEDGESQTQPLTLTSERQNDGSTVWHQQPILSYLDSSSAHTRTPSELIVGQFQGEENPVRHWQLQPVEEPRTESCRDEEDEDEDEDDTDTEGGMTVEISSGEGEDLEVSIGSGSDGEEEEINPDGGDGYGSRLLLNGDSNTNQGIPSMWRRSPRPPPSRSPLRPYSPAWDSEEQENADEFGPFDAATTASSGTRPTEDSEYHSDLGPPVCRPTRSSTPSSTRDGLDDGAGSIFTSRTSPPLESVAHSDIISLPDRPSSLPALHGQHYGDGGHRHVFSSPLNDNSTTARSSSISSFSSSLSSFSSSVSSYRPASPVNPSHARSHSAQPQTHASTIVSDHDYYSHNPPHYRQQHQRLGSGSESISTESTLTRTAGAHTDWSLRSLYTVQSEDTILGRREIFTRAVVPGSPQAVHYDNHNNSNAGQQLYSRDSPFGFEDDLHFPSPSLSVVDSVSDQTTTSSAESGTSQSEYVMGTREYYQDIPNNSFVDEQIEPLPSLGLLDEALQFIAEERARWEALRDAGGSASGGLSSDSERWKHELESSDSTPEYTRSSATTTTTKSTSTASASDLLLLSPPHSKRSPRKKKKQKKVPVTRVSGNATPIVSMSILRPDGTIIGGTKGAENGIKDTSIKRRSFGSDTYLGSGTLTPRMGSHLAAAVAAAMQGESTETDELDAKPRKQKKGKEKPTLPHSRSAPQMKISLGAGPSEEGTGNRRSKAAQEKESKSKHANVNTKINTANAQTHAVNTKRARLQGLAKQLQALFPEDKRPLDRVLKSLEHQKKGKKGKRVVLECSEEIEGEGEGEEELDPRGRPPRPGDSLVHVFIDHSNILFGLLTHLKRHPPRRPLPPTPNPTTTTTGHLRHTSTASPSPSAISTGSTTISTISPLSGTVIPLPSFATARTTQPGLGTKEKCGEEADLDMRGGVDAATKRRVRHLSHSALTLILERGRPITRRVVVTSSPLYQPIDGMERLGYQVSIFLRVPDLGDGSDRDRYRGDRSAKRLSGSGYGSAGSGPGIPIPNKTRGHARHVSSGGAGDFLGVGESGGSISAPSSYTSGAHLHTAMLARKNAALAGTSGNGSATNPGNTGTPQRIRFREQGVDELLQLKLHQALAAVDDVPEGATIVLATGDGNVGQFNEEGFLGPVRTALKRGWKVELYSWEGGLSRAWRREFGEESEWGKTGMFHVIGMEQFASSLVEDGWVSV